MSWRLLPFVALAMCVQGETDINALSSDDECSTGGRNGCSLEALQLNAVPSRQEVLEAKPTVTCETVVEGMDADPNWKLTFYKADFNVTKSDDIEYEEKPWQSWNDAADFFDDRSMAMITAYRQDVKDPCGAHSKRSVWFYPAADHNGVFDLGNDFVCSRMAMATALNHLDCIDVFRVSNVHEIHMILDRFTSSDTVVDAVLGGHGSNDPHGVLALGSNWETTDSMAQDKPTRRMLRKLGDRVIQNGVIFLDSCYSGRNGLGEFVSGLIPHAWVMGGIVSLDASIDMLPGKNGPAYIMSDFPPADEEVPTFKVGTQAIKVFAQGEDVGLASKYGAPKKDPDSR